MSVLWKETKKQGVSFFGGSDWISPFGKVLLNFPPDLPRRRRAYGFRIQLLFLNIKKSSVKENFLYCGSDWIRTSDLLNVNEAR